MAYVGCLIGPALAGCASNPPEVRAIPAEASPHSQDEARIMAVLAEMWADEDRRHLPFSDEDGRLLRLLTEAAGRPEKWRPCRVARGPARASVPVRSVNE